MLLRRVRRLTTHGGVGPHGYAVGPWVLERGAGSTTRAGRVGIAIAVVIRARDVVLGLVGLALGGTHIWQRGVATSSQWPTTTVIVTPDPTVPVSDPQHSISPP